MTMTMTMSGIKEKLRKKTLVFSVVASILLMIASVVAGVDARKDSGNDNVVSIEPQGHAILESSCGTTLYPDLCYSVLATQVSRMTHKISGIKDVIKVSLKLIIEAARQNFLKVEKITRIRKDLTVRQRNALRDCLETINETIDDLHEMLDDLVMYPNNKSLTENADDMKTLLSAAITNQETCFDGFSHDDADKKVREAFMKDQLHVQRMCSNALAMTKKMTDSDIAAAMTTTERKLGEEVGDRWPKWLSAGDRRLLQSERVEPDVVVARDGSGRFRTVAEAVAAAPEKSSRRYIIKIKAGVYRENVFVPKKKTNIMFMGDGRRNTIITASKNVADGSTTFDSATVAVVGKHFLARDIAFQNSAGPSKGQAVALRVGSDTSAFYECSFIAYQDTLYVHSYRQFFSNCLIVGTVDFIFGNSAVVIQDTNILARRPNPGQRNMITAQGRNEPNEVSGIVIHKCRIGATLDLQPVQKDFPSYLGRPWKKYSRTIIMQTEISDVIVPAGWHEWQGNFALDTLFYAEFQNTGAGANISDRVKWKGYKVLQTTAEAEPFTAGRFIDGNGWLNSTGFPFSLGL